MISQENERVGPKLMFVSAILFMGIGLVSLGQAAQTLMGWWSMQSWVEVPAEILEAKLVEHRSSDSTTFGAVARYKYVYQGREYEGDRIALDDEADNLGDFHREKAATLQRRMERRESVPCFVDPGAPERSVLYRALRFESLALLLVLALAFAGSGLAMMVSANKARRKKRRS